MILTAYHLYKFKKIERYNKTNMLNRLPTKTDR